MTQRFPDALGVAQMRRIDASKTEYPLHRGITTRDVAVAALFLVEGATTMTGECIRMPPAHSTAS